MLKNSVHAIEVTSIDATTLDDTFQVINAAGLPQPCFLLRIVNDSDVLVGISYDGINAHDIVPPSESVIINAQTNSSPNNYMAHFAKGTRVYISATVGTGDVYLIGYYQERS